MRPEASRTSRALLRAPRSSRVLRSVALLATAAVLTVLTACSAAPTSADTPHAESTAVPTPTATPDPFPKEPLTASTRYVALGDSFAAGMGGGDEKGKCRLSPRAYPAVFARDAGIDLVVNAACAGATTSDLLKHQLIALDDRTDLVTVSIGGNDLGVAAIAGDCAAGKAAACRNEVTAALSLLNVLPDRLDTVYSAIAQAAPNARIVVTGYTLLYDASDPNAPDFGTAAAINAATLGLNEVIRQAVDEQRAAGKAMTYLPVDFAGHAIGDRKPWLNTTGPDVFHPTGAGYAEYASRLVQLLGKAH
ncbi:SGNH/GDSL hydrolase family protein [Leifsonia sp. 1010]|uniref:SGNH/GDSL hydrolase family protein n=1 Tax=Leifsonia sp. 1010 TaxID=2817769 RepID=UPI0028561A17|nr:SGNH/GDSL hydrolase family protein [Leifsonia sp. 1010]MDR6612867.1 lysophospholipase L1-like esterase [Leifsonia sp. 1010]